MIASGAAFSEGREREKHLSHASYLPLLPQVTANVGFWGTLSLNIPDFTRYARSQGDQILGQAVGLPLFMAAFAFLGERRRV